MTLDVEFLNHFANEYNTSYLNESKEIKNLQKHIAEMDTKLNEATENVEASQDAAKLVES